MENVKDLARYILQNHMSNQTCGYEKNVELNARLHFLQNVHVALTGKKLFEEDLYAFETAAVVPEVQAVYLSLAEDFSKVEPSEKAFVDNAMEALENIDTRTVIELSREDSEWENRRCLKNLEDRKMHSVENDALYRKKYRKYIQYINKLNPSY